MSSRNVTLTLPSDLVKRAKVAAASRDTSLSSLVADFLERLTRDDDYEDLWRREQELMNAGLAMRVGNIGWTRDDLHDR